MTTPTQEIQAPNNDKEMNFRALEAKYQRQAEQQQNQLNQERQARLEAERQLQASHNLRQPEEEDESEPYVDHKRLKREQQKFGQQIKQETQSEIQRAVNVAIQNERQQNWLKSNPDFDEVMKFGDKFYADDPELAETVLNMPEGFERAKLVFKMIKAKELHLDKPKQSSIQQTVDANRQHPGRYQPTNVGSAPYAGQQADFSPAGMKAAHDRMQEVKSRLRL